jgi:hypothetical protein
MEEAERILDETDERLRQSSVCAPSARLTHSIDPLPAPPQSAQLTTSGVERQPHLLRTTSGQIVLGEHVDADHLKGQPERPHREQIDQDGHPERDDNGSPSEPPQTGRGDQPQHQRPIRESNWWRATRSTIRSKRLRSDMRSPGLRS